MFGRDQNSLGLKSFSISVISHTKDIGICRHNKVSNTNRCPVSTQARSVPECPWWEDLWASVLHSSGGGHTELVCWYPAAGLLLCGECLAPTVLRCVHQQCPSVLSSLQAWPSWGFDWKLPVVSHCSCTLIKWNVIWHKTIRNWVALLWCQSSRSYLQRRCQCLPLTMASF